MIPVHLSRGGGRPRVSATSVVLASVASLALASSTCFVPAAFSDSGNAVHATIKVAGGSEEPPPTRSVTVSPSTVTYGSCTENGTGKPTGNELKLPAGECFAPTQSADGAAEITVTNGSEPSQIDVAGAQAAPNGGGTDWQLCGNGLTCTGSDGQQPGADQYLEATLSLAGELQTGAILTGAPQCDKAFQPGAAGCQASADEHHAELLAIEGPESSSSRSATFTTSITWTAAAP